MRAEEKPCHDEYESTCDECYRRRLVVLRERRRSEVASEAAAAEREVVAAREAWWSYIAKHPEARDRERLPLAPFSGPLYPRPGLGYLDWLGVPCGAVELDFEREGWWPSLTTRDFEREGWWTLWFSRTRS